MERLVEALHEMPALFDNVVLQQGSCICSKRMAQLILREPRVDEQLSPFHIEVVLWMLRGRVAATASMISQRLGILASASFSQ